MLNIKDFNKNISYLEDLGREVLRVNAKYGKENENRMLYAHIREKNISYQLIYDLDRYIPYELCIYYYPNGFDQKKICEIIAESPDELWEAFKSRVRKGDFDEYIQD